MIIRYIKEKVNPHHAFGNQGALFEKTAPWTPAKAFDKAPPWTHEKV
jgi:hypothetical protein